MGLVLSSVITLDMQLSTITVRSKNKILVFSRQVSLISDSAKFTREVTKTQVSIINDSIDSALPKEHSPYDSLLRSPKPTSGVANCTAGTRTSKLEGRPRDDCLREDKADEERIWLWGPGGVYSCT